MLQSEFQERTNVVLTPEEYKKVEEIYSSVGMDKDEFCELWLSNRDNKIISELMDTIRMFREDLESAAELNQSIQKDYKEMMESHERELIGIGAENDRRMKDFAKRVIINAAEQDDLYSVLEEEFGMDFIIKTKLEADIAINCDETDYLIKKLS